DNAPGGAAGEWRRQACPRALNLLASRATSLGRLRLPPHPPEAGGALAALLRRSARAAETPCASGRATARRIRSRGHACRRHPRGYPVSPSGLRFGALFFVFSGGG